MNILRTTCLLLCLVALLTRVLHAAPVEKTLRVGDSDVYQFEGLTTTAVGNPAVADIAPLSTRRLLVNAKGVGQTTLIVFDRRGKHTLRLTVVPVPPDLGPAAARIAQDIGLPSVFVRAVGDTIFLEGAVGSATAAQRAEAIAAVYAPKVRNLLTVPDVKAAAADKSLARAYAALLSDSLAASGIHVQVVDDFTLALTGKYVAVAGMALPDLPDSGVTVSRPRVSGTAPGAATAGAPGADPLQRLLASLPEELRVVNLINFETRAARQILVRARIVDIDRNAAKNLGVSWGSLVTQDVRTMQSSTFQPQPILFGQMPAAGFFGSALGGGGLKRVLPLAAQLNALITENKARVLSEPSLLVLDGGEGHILVGGEIPIPVAQNNNGTGSASVTVEYRSYGVKLDCKAAIAGDNSILMTVTPEVSALDYGNLIQVNGFTIPALTVRRATSTLQMQDGQTLLIGGLYSNEATRQVQRIPLLSQIPILGEFFRNTLTRKQESELLILIEPEIVTAATAGVQPPPPGSLENLPIQKPDVERRAFDRDFPALTPSPQDRREAPKAPVTLPETTP